MRYKIVLSVALAAALGLLAGWFVFSGPAESGSENNSDSAGAENEPLYWVAPMDASFRRDKPGKSPMGMDLVPVYADDESANEADVQISPSVQQNLGVTTAPVQWRQLHPAINAVGFVGFNEKTLTHFHLRATGWISNLSVNAVGERVGKGQKLFDFYSPGIRNTQQEFVQALQSGSDNLIRAARAKLIAQGVPESEIEAIAKSRKIQSDIAYYADSAGVVAELNVSNGSFVSLEQNTLSVGPLEKVWVIAEVFERQAGLLAPGLEVDIRSRAYPERAWQGQIDYVYPVINPANRTTRARIVVDNPERLLRPNMLVDIDIDAEPRARQLTVPDNAVIRTGRGERVVREVSPGVFRTTVVETGLNVDGFIEILSGLDESDRVVTNAQFLIDSESSIHVDLERLSHKPEPRSQSMERGDMDHDNMDHGEMNHGDRHHDSMSESAPALESHAHREGGHD